MVNKWSTVVFKGEVVGWARWEQVGHVSSVAGGLADQAAKTGPMHGNYNAGCGEGTPVSMKFPGHLGCSFVVCGKLENSYIYSCCGIWSILFISWSTKVPLVSSPTVTHNKLPL